jgi:hypothetical protein
LAARQLLNSANHSRNHVTLYMCEVSNGKKEVSTSAVKWIEGISNRASIIIRGYVDQMKFAVYMDFPFIIIFPYSSG